MRYFKAGALVLAAVALFVPCAISVPTMSGSPAFAQSAPAAGVSGETITKMNAYVELLNRTLRASESLQRYASWVDMAKGPTGRERVVYGLYALYDVRDEIAAVEDAAKSEPKMPELDAAILAYAETYQKIAPVIEKANKYYERLDYKSDGMKGARAFHKQLAPLEPLYQERRRAADLALRTEKVKLDAVALEALEHAEGRKSRWHVRNVMMRAESVMDLMPDNEAPVVDMAVFKTALDTYADAVRAFDDYALDHPDSFHVFETRPASLLSKLRDLDERLSRVEGDARKGGGDDIEWIVSDYNTMVTTSQSATTFAKD
jgi:hypothetical protein